MIRRSLIIALLLLVGYMLFIRLVRIDWDTTQHLANGNRIKAERFIFSPADSSRTVIVGSSLAYRIDLDSFPPGTVNLGFAGRSIYDGMELILRAGKRPKLVLVESNILFRHVDTEFLDGLFTPGLYQLHRSVPIFREENQPSGVLYGRLHAWLQPGRAGVVEDSTAAPAANMLAQEERRYGELPRAGLQDSCMADLQRYVAALEEQGTQVVFFEIPIEGQLMELPLSVRSRQLVQEHFPNHRFVRMPAGPRWHTTDGLHLTKADARRYSGLLATDLALE